MSIIQTTATAGDQVWIPRAEKAGTRVEHAWGGSHVVLEVDGYERTDAPLWEARRALRRTLGATALVIATPWRSLRRSAAVWLLRAVTVLLCCGWVATGVALLAR
jgi:hypothetical protein